MSLSIGEIVGGVHKGNCEFGLITRDLLLLIDELAVGIVAERPLLNLLFELPGDITSPQFSGQRVGVFSRKEEILQIETAVPEEVLESMEAAGFIFESLRSAIKMAGERFAKRGLTFDVPAHLSLVDELERRILEKRDDRS